MNIYNYKGVDKDYKYKIGTIEAEDELNALIKIKEDEDILIIVSLQKTTNFYAKNSLSVKIRERLLQIENTSKDRRRERIQKKEEKFAEKQAKNKKVDLGLSKDTVVEKSPILRAFRKLTGKKAPENKSRTIELPEDFKIEIGRDQIISDKTKFVFKETSPVQTESLTKDKVDYVEKIADYERNDGRQINWDLLEPQSKDPEVRKNNKLKIKEKDLLLMTRRMQIMISSGLSLIRTLTLLRDTSVKDMRIVLDGILAEINAGNSLSQALAKYPKVFNASYVSLVSIGETSGELQNCLLDIISMKEQEQKVMKKVKTASIYPSIIAIVLAALLILASFFFLPKFEEMFMDQGLDVPMFTQIVFGIASKVPLIFLIIVGLLVALAIARKNIPGVNFWYISTRDKLLLTLPLIKGVTNALYMYKFSSTVSLMLKNGIRLSDTLSLAGRSINNIYIKSQVEEIGQLMIHGQSFSDSMRKQKHFDTILVNITHTGEESGQMVEALSKVADFYQTELNNKVDAAMEVVPSASMIAIGLIAAPIIVAAYLPILDISSGANLQL